MALVVQAAGSGRRRRYLPRTWRGWLGVVAAVLVVLLLIMYLMARMTPGWYQPMDPNSNQVIDAADVEFQLKANFHTMAERVPLGDQRWSISQFEVNSVLALHSAPPVGADGRRAYPAGGPYPAYSSPFVLFSPGKVTFAIRSTKVPGSGAGGVASIRFSVTGQAGTATSLPTWVIQVDGVWIGELRIPTFLVASKIRAYTPELIKAVSQTLRLTLGDSSKVEPEVDSTIVAIEEGRSFPLKFKYDRRVVIVKKIDVDDGVLSVWFGPETRAVTPETGSLQQPGLVVPN